MKRGSGFEGSLGASEAIKELAQVGAVFGTLFLGLNSIAEAQSPVNFAAPKSCAVGVKDRSACAGALVSQLQKASDSVAQLTKRSSLTVRSTSLEGLCREGLPLLGAHMGDIQKVWDYVVSRPPEEWTDKMRKHIIFDTFESVGYKKTLRKGATPSPKSAIEFIGKSLTSARESAEKCAEFTEGTIEGLAGLGSIFGGGGAKAINRFRNFQGDSGAVLQDVLKFLQSQVREQKPGAEEAALSALAVLEFEAKRIQR